MEHHKEEIEFLKADIAKLEQRIQQLEARNKRVENDKAWEISSWRRMLLVLVTYLVSVIVFNSLESPKPMKSALIPALAYWLSTLTLPIFKRRWLKSQE